MESNKYYIVKFENPGASTEESSVEWVVQVKKPGIKLDEFIEVESIDELFVKIDLNGIPHHLINVDEYIFSGINDEERAKIEDFLGHKTSEDWNWDEK